MARRHLIRRSGRRIRVLVAVMTSVAACGAERVDPAAAAETPIGRAITAELLSAESTDLTEAEASCISGEVVSRVGEDELRELGVTPLSVTALDDAELSGDQIEHVVDSWASCVDVRTILSGGLTIDIDDGTAACLSQGIDLDLAKALLGASLNDSFDLSDSAVARLAILAASCGVTIG